MHCLLLSLRPQNSAQALAAAGFSLAYFKAGNLDFGLAFAADKNVLMFSYSRFFKLDHFIDLRLLAC